MALWNVWLLPALLAVLQWQTVSASVAKSVGSTVRQQLSAAVAQRVIASSASIVQYVVDSSASIVQYVISSA